MHVKQEIIIDRFMSSKDFKAVDEVGDIKGTNRDCTDLRYMIDTFFVKF